MKVPPFIKYLIIVIVGLLLLYIGVTQFNKYSLKAEATNRTLEKQWKHYADSVVKSSESTINQANENKKEIYATIGHLEDSIARLHVQMDQKDKEYKRIIKEKNEKAAHVAGLSTDDLKRYFTDRYGKKDTTKTN